MKLDLTKEKEATAKFLRGLPNGVKAFMGLSCAAWAALFDGDKCWKDVEEFCEWKQEQRLHRLTRDCQSDFDKDATL